jgi:two-component system, LytTR family, sensor kinase
MERLKKVFIQVVFWTTIFVISLAFSPGDDLSPNALLFELICLLIYAIAFYLNILYVFPKFYDKNKLRYVLASAVLLLLSFFILHHINKLIFSHPERRHHGDDWFEVFISFRQLLWLAFIYLIGTVYSIQNMLNHQVIRNKEIMEEKLQTELQLLKAQINPHFLFNALNNIYSLTYMKSESAPESVLKLSEMLRYVLEDCTMEKVPVRNEIDYMQNLIGFYKMKSPGKRKIKFTSQIENMDIRIAPMLFIPFIENSFKYSRIEEDKTGYINIDLSEASGKVVFTIENSIFSARRIISGSGKGIMNVQQRLEIIYPGKHMLTIEEKEGIYTVNLEIDIL